MKIAVVDNENKWRIAILNDIKAYYQKREVEIDMYAEGKQLLKQKEIYNLLFMDIDVSDMDGFELVMKYKKIFPECIVIIVTMRMELSPKGYIVSAFRYIDKMNMKDDILEALKSVDRLLSKNKIIHINVVNLGKISFMLKDILYIETEKRNVRIHTKQQDFISNEGINYMEDLLEPYGFYRCHKSYIVNMDAVASFDHLNVYMTDGSSAMVSVRKYSELRQKYLEKNE